jgi:hypothetical protein
MWLATQSRLEPWTEECDSDGADGSTNVAQRHSIHVHGARRQLRCYRSGMRRRSPRYHTNNKLLARSAASECRPRLSRSSSPGPFRNLQQTLSLPLAERLTELDLAIDMALFAVLGEVG